MDHVKIFSTPASDYLARRIARGLSVDDLTPVEHRVFGDGEKYYRVGVREPDDLFGKTAVMVGSTHTDADLLEIQRVGTTLAECGTLRRIFVIPFYGYATMERAVRPGEVATAKTNARILSSIPNAGMGNVFLFLDLHVPGIIHYFEGDALRYEIHAQPVLVEAVRSLGLDPGFMLASADLGKSKRVASLARTFGTDIAFISKSRDMEKTRVLAVVGDVACRTVLIYDDMTRSGGTLVNAAEEYLKSGAAAVHVLLSHLAFNDDTVIRRLADSPIRRIIGTNSHPMSQNQTLKEIPKFAVVDIAPLFVSAIRPLLP